MSEESRWHGRQVAKQSAGPNSPDLEPSHRCFYMSASPPLLPVLLLSCLVCVSARANTRLCSRWQFNSVATQLIALSVSTVVMLLVMLGPAAESGNTEFAGMALAYAFLLPYFFGLASDMMMAFFSLLPSLERLMEYMPGGDLPSEAPRTQPCDAALLKEHWPQRGEVSFEGVDMRYRPDLPLALRGLTARLPGGATVGIVGRTGVQGRPPHTKARAPGLRSLGASCAGELWSAAPPLYARTKAGVCA